MSAVVATRDPALRCAGMELLDDLVLDAELRHRGRGSETERGEQFDEVVGDRGLGFGGTAHFITAKLKGHRQPMSSPVGGADRKGLHYVLVGDTERLRWFEFLDGTGEPFPTDCKALCELIEVLVEFKVDVACRVEVQCETAATFTYSELNCGASFDDTWREYLSDDGVGNGAL